MDRLDSLDPPAAQESDGLPGRGGALLPPGRPAAAAPLGRVIAVNGSLLVGCLAEAAQGDTTGPVARIGALVTVASLDGRCVGIINGLRRADAVSGGGGRLVEVQLLGELLPGPAGGVGSFQRGVSAHPTLDAPIALASPAELALVYARPDAACVRIGNLGQDRSLPAHVMIDSLLGKHLAVLGTTGSGKSCAVTVLLRAILDSHPAGHVVLLDPHNEYGSAFGERAERLEPSNIQLPYWLLTFEEIAHVLVNRSSAERAYAETVILGEAILEARRLYLADGEAGPEITVDTPVPYRLSDLANLINEAMGALNKAESTSPYRHLLARLDAVRADRRYEFMFASLAVRDTMRQVLARVLRIPVEGRPITIVDLSGLPGEVTDVVVSVLARLIFEFALWSERDAAPPVLLVCEEAHRYIPRDEGAGFGPTKRAIDRIAKEGRKYGLSLCLVSQRPSELSTSSLSQCNTVMALRMSNEHDQAFVRRALPESARWLIDSLPSLNTREAVVVGDGVTVPMHVHLDTLPEGARPASADAAFSRAWQVDGDDGFLARTIERWRHQTR
jgi:uncharacterized protein